MEPESYIEAGDEVLVVIRVRSKTARGIVVDYHGADVWTVRDGKATRMRWFNDVEQAFEAVGLASPG